MRPPGVDLTSCRALAVVKGEDRICLDPDGHNIPKDTALVIFRHRSGEAYALGSRCDWELWKQVGFQGMGTVSLIRECFRDAERFGIREKSIAWYLLCDVEREKRGTGSQR